MPIPVFVGAGAGGTAAAGTATVTKATCTAGNLMVLQVFILGAQSSAIAGGSNFENLAGTDNTMTILPSTSWTVGGGGEGRQDGYFGRVIADGTVSVDITASASAPFLARLYEISGVVAGATAAAVIENTENANEVTQAAATSTTISTNDVTTTGIDRLGFAFIAVSTNQALATLSPGGWVEPVAEFTSASPAGAISLNTVAMPLAATVSAGTITISSAGWACDITALIGAVAVTPDPDDAPIGVLGRGAGW